MHTHLGACHILPAAPTDRSMEPGLGPTGAQVDVGMIGGVCCRRDSCALALFVYMRISNAAMA